MLSEARKTRVIVLAGPVASGKTTLLCCLYQLYQEGPFSDTTFAGSRSLRAFEEVAHESRATSGLEVPTTRRTSRSQTGFLHLRLKPDGSEALDVMFSDLSGEPYLEVINRPSQAASLPAIHRADSVVIVVDGSALVDPRLRHTSAFRTQVLLRALLEHGGIRADADVDIVLTKWDRVKAAGEESVAFAAKFLQELAEGAATNYDTASFVTCGQSLADPSVPTGSGLDSLVKRWSRRKRPPTFGPLAAVVPATNRSSGVDTGSVA